METTIIYWGYNGIMENKMATTIIHYRGYNEIMENRESLHCHIFVKPRLLSLAPRDSETPEDPGLAKNAVAATVGSANPRHTEGIKYIGSW